MLELYFRQGRSLIVRISTDHFNGPIEIIFIFLTTLDLGEFGPIQ